MSDIIDTLHPKNSPADNLYPNIKTVNIPDKGVTAEKLADGSIDETKLEGGSLETLVNAWLDAHPEATTTVEDASLTYAKLSDALKNKLVKGDRIILSVSQVVEPYNDLNTFPVNSIVTIAIPNSGIANLPTGWNTGTVVTLCYTTSTTGGTVQFMISGANITFRILWGGGPSWGSWTNLASKTYVGDLISDVYDNFVKRDKLILSMQSAPYDDANTFPMNTIITVAYSGLVSNLPNDLIGTIITVSTNKNLFGGSLQIFNSTSGKMFTRIAWGGEVSWGSWRERATTDYVDNAISELTNYPDYLSGFKKLGCIGDSLASGECVSNETGTNAFHDIYFYSWGQYISRDYGIEVKNYSSGGQTTRSWLVNWLPLMIEETDKCDCYIIGLGVNDADKLGSDYLGTIDDIGETISECADSFYGNYAKIILNIRNIQPKAKIFMFTMNFTSGDVRLSYNVAIRNIASHYSIPCIDIQGDSFYTTAPLTTGYRDGHYSAIGYRLIADHMKKLINKYIAEHLSSYNQIEFIGTDWSYN